MPGIIIFVIALFIAATFGYKYTNLNPYWQGIAVESGGIAYEILLLTILFGYYEHRRNQQNDIENLERRIDDFKGLDNEYAHAIIASSLRELADKGKTEFDFRGAKLTKFHFYDEGIQSLKNSIFADGLWIDKPRNNFTNMKHIDFSQTNCSCVIFSKGILSLATYENCDFLDTDLRKASFTGATLMWDAESVIADEAKWSEIVDETEEGAPLYSQIYLPAFSGANLDQSNFDKCSFHNADFRRAKNILNASFIEAKGLDTCFFDEGIREKLKTNK